MNIPKKEAQGTKITGQKDLDYSIEHPLENEWTFWADRRSVKGKRFPEDQQAYESGLVQIGSFGSVEAFWAYFHNMLPPSKMDANVNLNLFRREIKPMWEDEANSNGGKWVVMIKHDRNSLDKLWEDLLLVMIGETLVEESDEICGAVLSRRNKADRISVWNRNKNNEAVLNKIGQRLMALYPNSNIQPPEYSHHIDSLKTSKSYANPTRHVLHGDRK